MAIELIIFDFDGTLVDSSEDVAEAFNYALELHGTEALTAADIRQLLGRDLDHLLEKMPVPARVAFDRETIAKRFFTYHHQHLVRHTRPYRGVPETLRELRRYKKVVVSNKVTELCTGTLDQLGILSYFDLVVGSDMVHARKPSPEPILFVLERFGVPPDRAVIVGDSMVEVEAGRAAGVRVIGAAYGFGSKGLWKNADFTIRGFSQLPNVLRLMDEKMSLTERWNPRAARIDTASVEQIIDLMNDEDGRIAEAVHSARDAIAKAARHAVESIKAGGSLIYIGAGTSGRIAALDAADIATSFGVRPDVVRAIVAGGAGALAASVEGAADDEEAGRAAVTHVGSSDLCLGISATGTTPFVLAALRGASERGARCWLLTFNDLQYPFLDGIIKVFTGPELVAGSTRLKAGTVTKMVLNMISTVAMVRLGHVYDGYMVDVSPINEKRSIRARTIIATVTGCSMDEAVELLRAAGGSAKTAILMQIKGLVREEAEALLAAAGGNLREALE